VAGVRLPAGAMAGGFMAARSTRPRADWRAIQRTIANRPAGCGNERGRRHAAVSRRSPTGEAFDSSWPTVAKVSESECVSTDFGKKKLGAEMKFHETNDRAARRLRVPHWPRDGGDDAPELHAPRRRLTPAHSELDSALAEKGYVLSMQFFREAGLGRHPAWLSELIAIPRPSRNRGAPPPGRERGKVARIARRNSPATTRPTGVNPIRKTGYGRRNDLAATRTASPNIMKTWTSCTKRRMAR